MASILEKINVVARLGDIESDLNKLEQWKNSEANPQLADLYNKAQRLYDDTKALASKVQINANLAQAAKVKAEAIAGEVATAKNEVFRVKNVFQSAGSKIKVRLQNIVKLTNTLPDVIAKATADVGNSSIDCGFMVNAGVDVRNRTEYAYQVTTGAASRIYKQMANVKYHAERMYNYWWVIWEVAYNGFYAFWRAFVQGYPSGYGSVLHESVAGFTNSFNAMRALGNSINNGFSGSQARITRTNELINTGFQAIGNHLTALMQETNMLFADFVGEMDKL